MKTAIALLILLCTMLPVPVSAAPVICLCTSGARTYPCTLRFEAFGVVWKPNYGCLPPPPQARRVDGLAAPLSGNQGGCGQRGMDTCTVSDAGKGFVALACDYYTVPERFNTRLKWRIGTPVTLWGCIALDANGAATELTAPFSIKKR